MKCKVGQPRNDCKPAAAHAKDRCDLRYNPGCHGLLVIEASECFKGVCGLLKS